MSANVDRSLDDILKEKKANRLASRRSRKGNKAGGKGAPAPVGGIKKPSKPAKGATKGTPTGPSSASRSNKIVVSGLPLDVTQDQIKEYFQKQVGPVRRVDIRYNQNGSSRGIADIIFSKPESATKAAKDLNGMLVDKRPMKIEVVMDAGSVPEQAPSRSLGERVAANPKAQPKSATNTKVSANGAPKGGRAAAGRGAKPKRGRNAGRPKPKTAEELDAEMTDYFGGNNANGAPTATTVADVTTNGVAEPAANVEDLGMDEIS